ncbi:MAG: 50S ribosomal protein L15 [Hyphomicrobiales bacterium]|jgi:large subunit ribosomal protein L15|tara:strand:- start:424 stop:894 length:471 start_codon:yes stop_codon:yes gene_type:complete
MRLNELSDVNGARKDRKRVGRGIGSGTGKTAGRGVKGQKSRSGVAIKGFEGGQMPLHRRLPKRGFNNIFAKEYNVFNLDRIQYFIDNGKLNDKEVINTENLLKAKLISKEKNGLKILGRGNLKSKVAFEVSGASEKAIKLIEKAGSKITIIGSAEK